MLFYKNENRIQGQNVKIMCQFCHRNIGQKTRIFCSIIGISGTVISSESLQRNDVVSRLENRWIFKIFISNTLLSLS